MNHYSPYAKEKQLERKNEYAVSLWSAVIMVITLFIMSGVN